MRRLLVAVALASVILLAVPAAARADDDYPPRSPGTGISTRPAPPGQALVLPRTGGDVTQELGVGAGLIALGGTLLVVTRRRRAARG